MAMHSNWNPWHGCVKCSDGWDNIFLNVTCENQDRADERIPLLLELPFTHKGLHCAPLLGPLRIGEYLDSGQLIPKEDLYQPCFVKKCEECSFRLLCNGCSSCGGC